MQTVFQQLLTQKDDKKKGVGEGTGKGDEGERGKRRQKQQKKMKENLKGRRDSFPLLMNGLYPTGDNAGYLDNSSL